MNEHFAEIVAECLEALENGTTTLEACLQKYPQYQTELISLLKTYQAVKIVPAVTPSLSFRQNAPARLLKKINGNQPAGKQKTRAPRRNFGLRKAATAILIVVLAFSATGVGAAYASSDDLPGDPLYGVKTTVENAQLLFSDDEGDVDLLNQFADRRVDEIKALTEAGRYEDIPAAVQSFEKTNNKLNDAVNELSANNPDKAEELAAHLEEARANRTETLTGLLDKVPEAAQKGIQTAIDAGPPEGKGKPDDKGKPEDAGCPPEDKGKPEDAGKSEDKDKDKDNENNAGGQGNGKGNAEDKGGGQPEGTGNEDQDNPNCVPQTDSEDE